jgi:hypothetical protein
MPKYQRSLIPSVTAHPIAGLFTLMFTPLYLISFSTTKIMVIPNVYIYILLNKSSFLLFKINSLLYNLQGTKLWTEVVVAQAN